MSQKLTEKYTRVTAIVIGVQRHRGFAFARTEDCRTWFLHMTDFADAADFERLHVGAQVTFAPLRLPGNQYRGIAARMTGEAEVLI